MSEKFIVKTEDGLGFMSECEYMEDRGDVPACIRLPEHRYFLMSYERCNAIQRKLCELSDGGPTRPPSRKHGEPAVHLQGPYNELALEECLEDVRKAKYQRKPMSPEEKLVAVEKVLDEPENPNHFATNDKVNKIRAIVRGES